MKPYCAICAERDHPEDLALSLSCVLPDGRVSESFVHRRCHEMAVLILKPFFHEGDPLRPLNESDWPHRPLLAGPVPDHT